MLRVMSGILLGALYSATLFADPLSIDFEGLADGTSITNQFPGVAFSDATAISAGASLNEADFPPHSGISVAFDDGGPMVLTFLTPALSFDGFFTYNLVSNPLLTIAAFDESNSALPVVSSSFISNTVSSGNPPNEELATSFGGGISRIVITGDPGGGSFVVDDVTINFAPVTTPEPSSIFLLSTGLAMACLMRAIRQRRFVRSAERRVAMTSDPFFGVSRYHPS